MRVLLIMAGFFIVIISHTIWTFGNAVSYPISAIAECVDSFADTDENQQKLEESLKTIRSLDIHSGDEIQKLYDAICRMTVSQTEQINDIKRLSDSTAKMQDGLIITMADMVEKRDSDTGEHIQDSEQRYIHSEYIKNKRRCERYLCYTHRRSSCSYRYTYSVSIIFHRRF